MNDDMAPDELSPWLGLEEDFDLNLLRVLLAMQRTHSVTRAAALLGMSQSGFSTALGRLRKLCDDPLFVRIDARMVPTDRAMKMIQVAAPLIASLHRDLLKPATFDPGTANTTFQLAMADLGEIVILPRLMAALQQVAPRVSLRTDAFSPGDLEAAMTAGAVDLAIGYFPELLAPSYDDQLLFPHAFACLMRRGHPCEQHPWTAAAYQQLGHILVTTPSRTGLLFGRALAQQGIERRIALRTSHYLSLPAIVESTDLVATVPLAVGARFVQEARVQLKALPFEPTPFPVRQHWHRRFQADPRHLWLRHLVASLFNELQDPWRATHLQLYGKPPPPTVG